MSARREKRVAGFETPSPLATRLRPGLVLDRSLDLLLGGAQNVMDNSRSSSPDALPEDLWSSILDSVSKSRSIPAKQVLVLGQPSTGKSTLISALLKKPPADPEKDDHRSDFALGYDWADVKDDADEGECAQYVLACLERPCLWTHRRAQIPSQDCPYTPYRRRRPRTLHYSPTSSRLVHPYNIQL